MSAVVTKSLPVVVRPSSSPEPEPAGSSSSHVVTLSSFDDCFASLPVTALLVFDQPIDDPVETIKRALSEALVHYAPIAGRLVTDDHRIACTGEGVLFAGASASCALLDLPASSTGDLTLQYPPGLCHDSEPLLLMQVTQFTCGGFTVAATWNHAIADGKGMAQFLQAVGELASGMPAPSVLPLRSCTLPVLPASAVARYRSAMKLGTKGMEALEVTVHWSLIRRIKAEHGGSSDPCTVFEAIAAVLWRCRTRAVVSDPEAAAPLAFQCNVRKHLGISDSYYGNCFTTVAVRATAGSVAQAEIGDLVNLIKSAKATVLLGSSNGEGKGEGQGESDGRSRPTMDQINELVYHALGVAGWRNLGFDTADFGHGTPSRVMHHMERAGGPSCTVCPLCKGKDGVNVMSLCVKPEHVDAFLAELASMM